MIETTRAQDEQAEQMAEQYGRCRVEEIPGSDDIRVVGMSDDVEMEQRRVAPDGSWRYDPTLGAATTPRIVQQPPKPARGYIVIRGNGKVVPCADMAHVGRVLLDELRDRAAAKVRARTSLTRDRELTADEQRAAVDAAVAAAMRELADEVEA